MRSAHDYLPLATVLAQQFAVHVIDRRGRGASGPQGADYTIDKECEDLLAVQAGTGATRVFGHSYGGLVVLETARRAPVFTHIAVYEPGVSVAGSIPTGWISRYRALLAAGDQRGAFAVFVQQSGHAPGPAARMPLWYLRAILRMVIRNRQWQHMAPLLAANAMEHEQVRALDDTVTHYAALEARVLLLGGSDSPRPATMASLDTPPTKSCSGLGQRSPGQGTNAGAGWPRELLFIGVKPTGSGVESVWGQITPTLSRLLDV